MAEERTQRRLAAVLAADVVGYSRLIDQDEAGTLAALKDRRKGVLAPLVANHHGRIVKVMGDGVLVEFGSAVNAVACAVELQNQMAAANGGVADDRRIALRIGINLGDLVVENGDLYGDGVIIAVRLQAMAEPGGICISGSVHEQLGNKLPLAFADLGPCEVKNIAKPVRTFRVRVEHPEEAVRSVERQPTQNRPSIA
jgi:class 3 adenylate cyclase